MNEIQKHFRELSWARIVKEMQTALAAGMDNQDLIISGGDMTVMSEAAKQKKLATYEEMNNELDDWWGICRKHDPGLPPRPDWFLSAAFFDAWRRAEERLLKETASEFVENRLRKLLEEARGPYYKQERELFRGEVLLLDVWRQYAERELT